MAKTTPYLLINWKNRDAYPYSLKDGEKELKRLERFLEKEQGNWNFACVIDPTLPRASNKIHYYHESQGKTRLTKDTYKELVKKTEIKIYIIPTQAEKRRTNNSKGRTKIIKALSEVADHYNNRVNQIWVYNANDEVTHVYRDDKLLTKVTKAQ